MQEATAVPFSSATADDLALLRRGQVAQLLGVSTRSLQNWERDGKITPVRMGAAVRFHPRDVRSFIDRHRRAPRTPAAPAPVAVAKQRPGRRPAAGVAA